MAPRPSCWRRLILHSGRACGAVRVLASAVATDSVAIHDRHVLLRLEAARLSAQKAYAQASVVPSDIDFFELHDAFTIMAALSLEATGFAEEGRGARLAMEGAIHREGSIPICTMGGLKARGHPVGATGVYQVAEAAMQLRTAAGPQPDQRGSTGHDAEHWWQRRDRRDAYTGTIGLAPNCGATCK